MADRRPIGVFDSGVGGISTLAEMTRLLPRERFLFYGDTAHAPYGTKPRETVMGYVRDVMETLLAQDVKAVAIACNTATSVAAAALRAEYDLPIIGMEPALKPAHELRHGGSILVLATPMTLKLEKFQRLMSLYGEGAVPLPCPGLMELVEREAFGQAKRYLTEHFMPYNLGGVDAVVLGCTHYSFLKPVLKDLLPERIEVLDGNLGTARQLKRVLEERGLLCTEGHGSIDFQTSGNQSEVLPQMKRLMRLAQDISATDEISRAGL